MLIKIREVEESSESLRGFAIGGVLLSPFAKILAGVLLTVTLSSVGLTVYKTFQLKNMEIRLLETENKLVHASSELVNCHNKVEEQNKEITDLQIDAAEDVALVKKINEQLNNSNAIQEKEIERLKKQSAPATCEDSKNWLKENIKIYGESQ